MPEFDSFDEPHVLDDQWALDTAEHDAPFVAGQPFIEEDLDICPDAEQVDMSDMLNTQYAEHIQETVAAPSSVAAGPGERFLHERDPRFHASASVEAAAVYIRSHGTPLPNQPEEKISAYLDLSADPEYGNDGIITGDEASLERQVEARVIKAEDMPEGYFALQQRIAREQGHGDVRVTDGMRSQITRQVQEDQRASLRLWADHLSGTLEYPVWYRHYVWDGLSKLGMYNKDFQSYTKQQIDDTLPPGTKEPTMFAKRGPQTVAPYPELNHEALAYVRQWLQDGRIEGELNQVDDEALRRRLAVGQFGKLYGHALTQIKIAQEAIHLSSEGSWRVFKQSSHPNAVAQLTDSLQGYGTGWCTASSETAATHLQNGDFHVYYTQNKQGEHVVPRVAIRMENGKIAEVRGIENNQEIEPDMTAVAGARLETFPDNEEYRQKAQDMQRLTALDKQLKENPTMPLDRESLRFLYEYDRDIEGFADRRDPRIIELRQMRREMDCGPLKELLLESVRENIGPAARACREVAAPLAGRQSYGILRKEYSPPGEAAVLQMFAAQHEAWEASGLYDFVASEMQSEGGRYELLATPNVTVDHEQVMALAQGFAGEDADVRVYDKVLGNRYSAQQLSGRQGNAPVRFSLLAVRPDNKISGPHSNEQVDVLASWQKSWKNTGIRMRFPAVLDAVTLWHTLRARGDVVDASTTRIDHTDLSISDGPQTDMTLHTLVEDDGNVVFGAANGWTRRRPRVAFS